MLAILGSYNGWTMGVLGKTKREAFSQHHQSIIRKKLSLGFFCNYISSMLKKTKRFVKVNQNVVKT
jgi:hypothetical protein